MIRKPRIRQPLTSPHAFAAQLRLYKGFATAAITIWLSLDIETRVSKLPTTPACKSHTCKRETLTQHT